MRKTFKFFCVAALSLLAVSSCGKIEDSINDLKEGLDNLTARVEKLEQKLNDEVSAINTKINGLDAAYKAADAELLASITTLTANLDALDGKVDGFIKSDAAAILAAIEELKAADKALAGVDSEILAALVNVGVTKVEKNEAGNAVLTFTDGTTLEVPAQPGTGVVTVVEVEGVKYWAVVVNGEAVSLDVPVGHNELEFKVDEDGALLFSVDGGKTWNETGAYVAEDADSLIDFYQGSEWDDYLWEEVVDDYYTLVFGGETYYLPLYKVDNSVVALKAGKTYFEYGETVTVDVVLSDITSMYVMTKPDGWRVSLEGKKLTVTAPAENAVEAGYAESDGEVLLHCTTTEGKCKIAKLAVATTPGFSLTLTKDGKLTIVNPEIVTNTSMWGDVSVDFNDAYIGLAPVASFEADPAAYVQGIQDNWDDQWIYINNWKMNSAEYDEDWNPIYKIGGAYEEGVYEVDVIETTVEEMYADWTWGAELPATPFVVWACPMDENGQARIEDLVYAYYYPSIKATITEVEATATGIEVAVNVVGATQFYVGAVTEEMTYGFPIDQFMQMQEGPFGYFQMALQYGMPDYAFQQMGMPFTAEEMPESINVTDILGGSLMPNTKVYMWVFPIPEGVELADYTYEANLKPYIYEFTTGSLSAGGSAAVEFGEEDLRFAYMSVELSATEGAEMIYYSWMDEDTYNAMDEAELTEYLLANGLVLAGNQGLAVNENQVTPGAEFFLAALAVDAEFKYGEPVAELFAAPSITFSETFTATIGDFAPVAYYSGYKYDFPITIEGGDVAKYYYVFSETEYTDEELANLPLTYDYDYNFRSTTNVSAGKVSGLYANAGKTYYFAVVAESTTGELSKVAKVTVEVPAAAEE